MTKKVQIANNDDGRHRRVLATFTWDCFTEVLVSSAEYICHDPSPPPSPLSENNNSVSENYAKINISRSYLSFAEAS